MIVQTISGKTISVKRGKKQTSLLSDCAATPHKLHPQLMNNVCYGFFKVAMRMRGRMDESLKPYQMITPQYAMLRILNIEGRMTQVELGTYLAMDKATMVRMLDSLEELKYVKRVQSEKDRRSKYLELTPAGKKVMAALEKIRSVNEAEFLSPLGAREQAQLCAIVGKLLTTGP